MWSCYQSYYIHIYRTVALLRDMSFPIKRLPVTGIVVIDLGTPPGSVKDCRSSHCSWFCKWFGEREKRNRNRRIRQ